MNWHHISKRYDPAAYHYNAKHEVKWIVEHLRSDERLLLDVGCLDSGLLDMLGFTYHGIIGIDIRRLTGGSKFVKQMDIRQPTFTKGVRFDAIIFLSTLEHIGLNCYGNKWLSPQGDGQALSMSRYLLAEDGHILVTMPWNAESQGRSRGGNLWERRYNHTSAMALVYNSGLDVVEYVEDRRNEIICMELKHD